MKSRLKVYIAGPYTAETPDELLRNVNRAIDAAFKVFAKGHFPYIPHLTHFIDLRARETRVKMEWEDYMRWDMVWVEACDALLYLGPSKGADVELRAAQSLGKEIFSSIEEIPSV